MFDINIRRKQDGRVTVFETSCSGFCHLPCHSTRSGARHGKPALGELGGFGPASTGWKLPPRDTVEESGCLPQRMDQGGSLFSLQWDLAPMAH